MKHPSTPPLFLQENPVAVPIPRAVEKAYLWVVAGLGGVATVALFVFAVATQSGEDARRIASGAGMAPTLVGALAATHGRPGAI